MKTQRYFKIGLLLVSCLALVSACGPSAEQLAATGVAAQTQTQSARPSVTLSPSLTTAPTSTETQTSEPTQTLTATETRMATETLIPTPIQTPKRDARSTPTVTAKTHQLKIVSSLPMTGMFQTLAESIANGMQLRVDQAHARACNGKYTIQYEALDDASAAAGKWDPDVEIGNARQAAADRSIIAYLGTYNSGAAMLSIPILNEAGPLVMISPGNTNPSLTKATRGMPDVTKSYYPTGVRNYARVIQSDDVQGATAAGFVRGLGAKTVYILDDGELYGKATADAFEIKAKEIGLRVLGHESFDPGAADYKLLMTKIARINNGRAPDAMYVGAVADNNAAQLLKDKVSIVGDNTRVKFIGPDALQNEYMIASAGAEIAEGIYASIGSLPVEKLPDSAKQFVRDYEAQYGKLSTMDAVYGYEAMNVTLKAIEDVCASGGDPGDRASITRAVFAIKDFDGILGTWSFDKNGDTSLTDTSFYQVKNGVYVLVGTGK